MNTRSAPPYAALALASLAIVVACSGKSKETTGQGGSAGHSGSSSTTTATTGSGGGAGCPDVPSQILAPSCGKASCHGSVKPAAGLDLVSPDLAARLTGKMGDPGSACPGLLTDPAHPSSSLLYKRLVGASCGPRMPLAGSPLAADEIACVKGWIASQATGTGGVGGVGGTGGVGGVGGVGGAGGAPGPGTCTDAIKNGVETDVDCGGLCPFCPVGKGCAGPTDCESFSCANDICVEATCTDLHLDGAEADVDCGGPACPPCAGGKHCAVDTDCASGVCQPSALCASSCTDGAKDGLEQGIDCGGVCPIGCPPGNPCAVAGDCASYICTSGACATPTCTDLVSNGGESDVDCGGPCAPCALGKQCAIDADCATGGCVAGACEHVLYLSEVRTRGKNGNTYTDEFIELHNPGAVQVTVDATWKVVHRNAIGGCQGTGYGGTTLFVGGGQSIPAHGHMLIVGTAYAAPPAADAPLLSPSTYGVISDAGSITVLHHGSLVDTLCYFMDAPTKTTLATCAPAYACAGAPVDNTQASNGLAWSFERKPGGALGNGQSTGNSGADFLPMGAATPQNLASPATP